MILKKILSTIFFVFLFLPADGISQTFIDMIKQRKLEKRRKDTEALKIWDPNRISNEKIYTVDNYKAVFKRESNETGNKDFTVVTTHPRMGFNFKFKGSCTDTVYLKSRFPLRIVSDEFVEYASDFFEAATIGFRDQCENLVMIDVEIPLADGVFYGKINEKTSWKLVDDMYDNATKKSPFVRIKTPYVFSNPLGASYVGRCEDDLIVHIGWQKHSPTDLDFGDATMYEFKEIAKVFIEEYLEQCTEINTISFVLDYMPKGYYCKTPGKCRIYAKKEDGWNLTTGAIKSESERTYLFNDYKGLIEYLTSKRDLEPLMAYSDYVKVFYQDLLEQYGEQCKGNLPTYDIMEYQSFRKSYDSNGTLISSVKNGPPQVLYIEPQKVKIYKEVRAENKSYLMSRMMSAEVTSRKQNSYGGSSNFILKMLQESEYLNSYLKNNCGNPNIQLLYKRANEFALKL